MACRIDEFNNHEQRNAAKQRIALLKHRGLWADTPKKLKDRLEGVISGYYFGWHQIKDLCTQIQSLGGTEYLQDEMRKNPTPEISGVFSWWVDHERKDKEAAAEAAEIDE